MSARLACSDSLARLLVWFWREFGIQPGACPTNAAIAERIGLTRLASVTRLLREAETRDLLTLIQKGGNRGRTVQLRPAGCDLARAAAKDVRPPPKAALQPPDVAAPAAVDLLRAGDFAGWLDRARHGERWSYFIGHLAEARGQAFWKSDPGLAAILAEADLVAKAAERGEVVLVTRRVDDEAREYIAVRCRARSAA